MSVKNPVKQACSLCGETKSETEYYRRDNGSLRSQCISCYKIMNKIQRQPPREAPGVRPQPRVWLGAVR